MKSPQTGLISSGGSSRVANQELHPEKSFASPDSAISGRLQSRNWQDQEGTWHNLTEVVAHEVVFLDRKVPEDSLEEPF